MHREGRAREGPSGGPTSFWLLTIPGALALIIGVALAATFPDLFNVPSDIDEQAQICVLSR